MKAVILAGGFGTRLRPLTVNIPKPMVPIMNIPIIEHTIGLLKKHNLKDITIMLYFQPEVIMSHLRDGSKYGVKIKYVTSDRDLGTAGCLGQAANQLKSDQFLVISGDVLTNFNLTEAMEFHNKKRAIATMLLTHVKDPLRYGIVIADSDGRIKKMLEKPSWGEVFSDTVNAGIFVFDPQIFNYIPKDTSYDTSKNLFPDLVEKKEKLFGHIATGYWRDIGTLAEYRHTHEDILNGEIECEIKGERKGNIGRDIWIGHNVKIDPSAVLKESVVIGDNCTIEEGVEIANSVIGDGCYIDSGAKIVKSIIWDKNVIEKEVDIKEAVLGTGNKIRWKAYIGVGAVISDNCFIGKETIIKPEVKLWPNKTVDDFSTVSSSLIWGERWSNHIFDVYGITAVANKELTPEIGAKIGAAYASALPKDSYVLVSRDYHRSSFMIERSIMSGILSAGVNIYDMRIMPLSVTKYVGKSLKVPGFHIRKSPYDEKMLDIKFFDSEGLDISFSWEKSIESSFFREEYRRVENDKVGVVLYPPRALEYYREGFMRAVDKEKIKEKKFKIIIDYSYSSAVNIFPSILGELNCEVIALNAHTDESRLTRSPEKTKEELLKLSEMVKTLKASAGIMIDAGCQKISIVDDRGRALLNDHALMVMSKLFLNKNKKAVIAVPVNVTNKIEEMVNKLGGSVIRVGTTYRAMMKAADTKQADFVAEEKGGYIFSEFEPSFDAMMSTVKFLELLAYYDKPLSKIVDEIPDYTKLTEEMPIAMEIRGAVMKQLITIRKAGGDDIEGIQFKEKGGRALIIPDNDRPVFHIYAEAKTAKSTKAILKKYINLLKKVIEKI